MDGTNFFAHEEERERGAEHPPTPNPPTPQRRPCTTHVVAMWPPEPARGCCGGAGRPLCVAP
eukprot:1479324-Prymnesium_polylepis.1